MKRLCLALLLLLLPALSHAQIADAGAKLGWDMPASTLGTANSYTYRYYPDGATTGISLTGVVCTGTTSPFPCTVPFPAFSPGTHTLTVTAGTVAGTPPVIVEGPKSAVLSFTFVVVPGTPLNPRIIVVP
jgi:hypothetical protein